METEEEKTSRLNAAHEVSKDFMLLKKKMKKYLLIALIVLIVLIIIKILFGTIEIYNPAGYPSYKNPSFDIKINGDRVNSSGYLYHHIPIIPFFLDFVSDSFLLNTFEKDLPSDYSYNGKGKINLSIQAYVCYYKDDNHQAECSFTKENIVHKEKNDVRYTKVIILKNQRYWDPIYEGPFIADITDYVKDDGYYMIMLYGKYSLVEVENYFYIDTKNE